MLEERKTPGRERRRDQRFAVKERAIAVLQVGSRFTKLGRIVDVSRGGLAFDYVPMDVVAPETMVHEDEVGPVVLSILSEEGVMAMRDVFIQTVSDRPLISQMPAFASVATRRCGVRFRDLSMAQRSQLDEFLIRGAAAYA